MPEILDRVGDAIEQAGFDWKRANGGDGCSWADIPTEVFARAAIAAVREPTETMWGGLARDLVMWDRGMPNQYGSTLYKHLRASGVSIPAWLLQEIPDIDHTPPKGTVAVCIFKAMIDAALESAPPAGALMNGDGVAEARGEK